MKYGLTIVLCCMLYGLMALTIVLYEVGSYHSSATVVAGTDLSHTVVAGQGDIVGWHHTLPAVVVGYIAHQLQLVADYTLHCTDQTGQHLNNTHIHDYTVSQDTGNADLVYYWCNMLLKETSSL